MVAYMCEAPTHVTHLQLPLAHARATSTKRWHTSTAGCVVNKAVAHINCGLCRRQQSGGTHQLRAVSSTKRWHTSTAGCVVGCWPTPPLYTSNAKRTSGWRCQVSINPNVGPAQTAALSVSKIQRCILLRGSWMRVPVCACLVSVASHRAPGCVSSGRNPLEGGSVPGAGCTARAQHDSSHRSCQQHIQPAPCGVGSSCRCPAPAAARTRSSGAARRRTAAAPRPPAAPTCVPRVLCRA
jgi:hypothetical protein